MRNCGPIFVQGRLFLVICGMISRFVPHAGVLLQYDKWEEGATWIVNYDIIETAARGDYLGRYFDRGNRKR